MISKLAMIAKSKDPKADLRKEMAVEILKNTFLIRVGLASQDPEEAALIVNAVVDFLPGPARRVSPELQQGS